jgi:hypothetical protein
VCVHLYPFEVVANSAKTPTDASKPRSKLARKDVKTTIQTGEPQATGLSTFGGPSPPRVPFRQSKTTKVSDLFANAELMADACIE